MAFSLIWGLLLPTGCDEPVEFQAATEAVDASTPDRIDVGSAVGAGEVEIPVRLVNKYGAAVPGREFELSLVGDSLSTSTALVTPDALGFASVTVSSEVSQGVKVIAVSSADNAKIGDEDTSWITGGDLQDLGLQRAFGVAGWGSFAARGGDGVAYVVEDRVYWQRTDRPAPPLLVLELPDIILGLDSTDLDLDGYPDLVVWTQTRVVMLRGRGVDGYAWSGGFTTPGARLRGVDVGRFDDNSLPDLAVGFADNSGGLQGAQVLLQDGFGSWEALPPLERELEVTDVTLGDFLGSGLSELVVLTAEGPYRYGYNPDYTEAERAWSRVDPDLTWLLESGSELLPSSDLDGDRNPELIAAGPSKGLGSDRELAFYTIDDAAIRYSLTFPDFVADIYDITGDGVDDLALLIEDGDASQLRTVTGD